MPQVMPRKAAWIGADDPFLRAAVEVSGPIVWTDAIEEAEFVVVNEYAAGPDREHEPDPLPEGNLFLVSVAENLDGGSTIYASMEAVSPSDPILQGISSDALRVDIASLPEGGVTSRLPGEWVPLLTASEREILVSGVTETGRWIALVPDLWRTNLPLSIDFPLLVANIVAYLSPRAEPVAWEQMEPGQAVDLGWASPVMQVIDPNGDVVQVVAGTDERQRLGVAGFEAGGVLLADMPGFYEISAASGSILMAFNVAVAESETATMLATDDRHLVMRTEAGLLAIWPWVALAACLVLMIEAVAYHGAWSPRSRR